MKQLQLSEQKERRIEYQNFLKDKQDKLKEEIDEGIKKGD